MLITMAFDVSKIRRTWISTSPTHARRAPGRMGGVQVSCLKFARGGWWRLAPAADEENRNRSSACAVELGGVDDGAVAGAFLYR